MGDAAQKITPIFVTLDPARDTPAVMKDYVAAFDPRLMGLTGTQAQIDAVAASYKVYHSKQEIKDSAMGYVIDHSGWIYLMDEQDRYVAHFKHDIAVEDLVEGLKKHVR